MLKKFIKSNANVEMIIKQCETRGINTNIVSTVFNTKMLKTI